MRRAPLPLALLVLGLALALWAVLGRHVVVRTHDDDRPRPAATQPLYVPVVPAPVVRGASVPPTPFAAPSQVAPAASATGLDRLFDPALATDREWWDWPEAVFVCDADGKRTIFRPEDHPRDAEDVYERKFPDGSLRFYDPTLGPRNDDAAWRNMREYTRPDGTLLANDLPHCTKEGVRP